MQNMSSTKTLPRWIRQFQVWLIIALICGSLAYFLYARIILPAIRIYSKETVDRVEADSPQETNPQIVITHVGGEVAQVQTKELVSDESDHAEDFLKDGELLGTIRGTIDRITSDSKADDIRIRAESGDSDAMVSYALDVLTGNSAEPQFEEAAKWLKKSADQDNPEAMNALGEFYWEGLGVPKDDQIAFSLIQKSAEAGFHGGMYNLGQSYNQGRGVAKDDAMALKWYEKAAEAEVPSAMNALGVLYFGGLGTPEDRDVALTWFRRAAQGGNLEAMCNLGNIYRDGLGVAQDYGVAFGWFEAAAKVGDTRSMHNLANLYRTGRGVEKDVPLAIEWFTKAALLGQTASMKQLVEIYRAGDDGVPKDWTYAEYWKAKAEAAEAKAEVASRRASEGNYLPK